MGAVTHGYQFDGRFPAWVDAMAAALRAGGYDAALSFDWAGRSNSPSQGMGVQAGRDLAGKVATALRQILPVVGPGDAVDVHLIGHSRGSVVMSQAALALQAMQLGGTLPQLQAGRLRLTFLDPHPAHNTHTVGPAAKPWYSVAEGPVGSLALRAYLQFQDAARDPEVIAPDRADEVEVYSQHTGHGAAADSLERVLNLWGEVPVQGNPARYCDLTGFAMGHLEVHDWYLGRISPGIPGQSPIPCPGSTGTPSAASVLAAPSLAAPAAAPVEVLPSAPAAMAAGAAQELAAIYPEEIDDRAVAIEILRRHAVVEVALEGGRTADAIEGLTSLRDYIERERGRHVTPRAADFFEDKIRLLLQALL